jgi:hypothetical protein
VYFLPIKNTISNQNFLRRGLGTYLFLTTSLLVKKIIFGCEFQKNGYSQ